MNMEKIITLLKSGLNSEEISKNLKINKLDVDLKLLEYGFTNSKRKSSISIETYKTIIIDRHNGVPMSKTCEKFGISLGGVSKKFKKFGIYFPNIKDFDYSVWTSDKILELISDFNSGIPVYKLVEKYGFNKDALAKIINANGGNTQTPSFDIDYFNTVTTEEQAYWLGFLYADGYVSSDRNEVELSLQLLDAEHLNKFKVALHSNSNIILDFAKNRCRFQVSNKKFKTDLCKLGCNPNKSLVLEYKANLNNDELIRAFIRGYFDGDGCLTHTYTDNKTKLKFTVSTSLLGTKSFLSWIEQELNKHDIICTWYHDKRHSDNIWTIEFNKQNSVKLLNYLYTNCTIYLNRKYNKYKYFAEFDNFAVYVSDYVNYNRTISEKAKSWIKEHLCEDFDLKYANAEITKKSKDFLAS